MENKELETWLSETKAKNLSLDELESFIEFVPTCPHSTVWSKLKGETNEEKAQILFNQWQQEPEFSPKRGDRVIVWDFDESKAHERIFLADIKGSVSPIVTVPKVHEVYFKNNETFGITQYKNMKPLPTEHPTETDFKSKVIELIEKRIDVLSNLIPTNIQFELYATAHKNKESKEELSELLTQIKNLC